jgi:hypothetical protein
MVSEAMARIGAREFRAARVLVEALVSADPSNNWGEHARIHLHIDEGTLEEGAIRGLAHLEAVDPFDGINVHNAMHLATILLDLGRADESVAWQERVVVPVAEKLPMQYPSATHLLWRTEVAGHGRTAGRALPWQILTRPGASALDGPDDRPDAHEAIAHAMAWIANGDGPRRESLLSALLHRGLSVGTTVGSSAHEKIVAAVVDGLYGWWEGDFAGAAERLGEARSAFARLTEYPSHLVAIDDTLIDAEWRSRKVTFAEAILRERIASSNIPNPFDVALLSRFTST